MQEKNRSTGNIPAWQLCNLATDIGEQNDVAPGHPQVVKDLNAHFEAWRASMHPSVE